MKKPKLLAMDLDGTLFNEASTVSEKNREAISAAQEAGVEIAISTGRPFIGLPLSYMEEAQIRYAITTNGAGVYKYDGEGRRACLFSQCMEREKIAEILPFLLERRVHFDVFIDGDGFSDRRCRAYIDELPMPLSLRNYIRNSRNVVEDISKCVEESSHPVQKITMNFPKDEQQGARREVWERFSADPYFRIVSGGFSNLELTRHDVSKAAALEKLAEHLGFTLVDTMAIGDSGNDLDMIRAAGTGVAMGNSEEATKAAADFVTLSNTEDGVAAVIWGFLTS
ncbi:MAG: HAD family phosphatase [Lachnospiraceae bacterium]|nr:HAD family phosphatase [Lachnospiraceae bacterium]